MDIDKEYIDRLGLKYCKCRAELEGEFKIVEKIKKQLVANTIFPIVNENYRDLQDMNSDKILSNKEYDKCVNWLNE